MIEQVPMRRALAAEAAGTAGLVAVIVGSGISAQSLFPGTPGLALLANSVATMLGLAVLIAVLGPVSGGHFNPVVSAALWLIQRGTDGPSLSRLGGYLGAQVLGGLLGVVLANAMFALAPVQLSHHPRDGAYLLLAEVVATAGLIATILMLARTGRGAWTAAAVGAYIGAAYWFTSSTAFANPAVTIARMFTDTFTGIAPGSVPGFIAAQALGAAVGLALAQALVPARTAAQPSTPALEQGVPA